MRTCAGALSELQLGFPHLRCPGNSALESSDQGRGIVSRLQQWRRWRAQESKGEWISVEKQDAFALYADHSSPWKPPRAFSGRCRSHSPCVFSSSSWSFFHPGHVVTYLNSEMVFLISFLIFITETSHMYEPLHKANIFPILTVIELPWPALFIVTLDPYINFTSLEQGFASLVWLFCTSLPLGRGISITACCPGAGYLSIWQT